MFAQDRRTVDIDVHRRPASDNVKLPQVGNDMLGNPKVSLKAGQQGARVLMDRIEARGPAAADDEVPVCRLFEGQMSVSVGNETRYQGRCGLGHHHLQRSTKYGYINTEHRADL